MTGETLPRLISGSSLFPRRKLFWKNVVDTQVIAACGPPGGGRNAVTPRLLRHFFMQWIPDISKDAMVLIFDSILNGWLTVGGLGCHYGITCWVFSG